MADQSITTETGTVVTLQDAEEFPTIVLDHPDAPADMRRIEVGRITHDGEGFQPAPFVAGSMRPAVLRAIADLMENKEA